MLCGVSAANIGVGSVQVASCETYNHFWHYVG